MRYPKPMLVMIVLLCGVILLRAAVIDDFREAYAQAGEDSTERAKVFQTYAARLKSVEDLRELQNYWMQEDSEACTRHFAEMQKKNPQDPIYKYLNLRFVDDPELQMDGAILLCQKHPDFYWGYRLFIVNYLEWLLEAKKEITNPLEGEQFKLELVEAGLKNFPDDAYLNIFQFHRYLLSGEDAKAEAALMKVTDNQVIGSNWMAINDLIVKTKNQSLFDTMMGRFTSYMISRGQISAADSTGYHDFGQAEMYVQWKDWPALEQFFIAHPDYLQDRNFAYLQELMYLETQNYQPVIASLSERYEAGEIDYPDLSSDQRYEVLAADSTWQELLIKAKLSWDQDEPKRREEALKDRIGTPAPLWELPDAEGNITKLQDYQGDVIVLDFWATWCGPCQKAMPALNNWMQHEMPKGTKVFSINLWDKGNAEKAKQLFSDAGYAMTLLFGPDSLSKEYGFDGIPYICVIDKAGKIAYAQSGYSPTLEEKLSFWVNELIRE